MPRIGVHRGLPGRVLRRLGCGLGLAWGALLPAGVQAQARAADGDVGPAALTVLVVVDQLRPDLLERYDDAFTGGFRRLRDRGFRFERTTHDHALTLTAPGHATLATGTHPATHGVVSNAWIEDRSGGPTVIENVVDPAIPVLGHPRIAGASPAPLQRSTLAEWLQSAHPDARVLSVSAKSRAAVLLAGRARAQVYWYEPAAGRFVTSTHYATREPAWVGAANRERVAPLVDSVWTLEVPAAHRGLAGADTARWEANGIHTFFPHRWSDYARPLGQSLAAWWASTPGLDRATRLFAQAGAEALELGGDAVPDLLLVSLSQTDRVGHVFGPRSLEMFDQLLRLDRELDLLLEWLDREIGAGRWTLALTADHGAADVPELAAADGHPAYRITTDSALVLQELVSDIAAEVGTGRDVFPDALAERLPALSWIERAWTFDGLLGSGAPGADSLTVLQRRSTYPGRRTGVLGGQGVELLYAPWTLPWSVPRGTTHGTPWLYDRHVPFVLIGAGAPPAGSSAEPVGTVDVAPTLADLLGITPPDGVEGRSRLLREGGAVGGGGGVRD